MRILVLGATGGIGGHVIREGLARGHGVTGMGRAAAGPSIAGVSYIRGDVSSAEALQSALLGHDAVVSALGARDLQPTRIMQEATAAALAAMQGTGVRRIVVVSAAMLYPGLLPVIVRQILRHTAADARAMEARLQASNVEWTVVRPPRLTEDLTRGYRSKVGGLPFPGMTLGRLGVALSMLDALEQGTHKRQILGVSK